MICKICNKITNHTLDGVILGKYSIKYFHCLHCGFIQTEKPYWIDESYASSINISDTASLERCLTNSAIVTITILLLFNKKARFLDYAGGYGLFTRRMRDIGFDFYWMDKYTKNIMARGFEFDGLRDIELITSFESFEHFIEPLNEIEKILSYSRNIFFTTELLPNPVPLPDQWHYYGSHHGQHVSLYSYSTLGYLAKKYNLYFNSYGHFHLFTEKPVSKYLFLLIFRLHKYKMFYLLKKLMVSKTIADSNSLVNNI